MAQRSTDTPETEIDEYRALVQSAPDVIMRLAADGTVRVANRALNGGGARDVIGSSWLAGVPASDHPRLERVLREVIDTRAAARFEAAVVRTDGATTSYSSHLGPLVHEGSVIGAVLIARETVATSRQPPASAPGGPATGRPRGRILVIDDEPMIAVAIKRTLAVDHDVVAVGRGEEALGHLADGQDFDVILCDLMMPHMTGMDVHAEISRTRPDLAGAMVFLTGGAFTASARMFLESVPNVRLEKPFDPRQLRQLVADRVRARRGPGG